MSVSVIQPAESPKLASIFSRQPIKPAYEILSPEEGKTIERIFDWYNEFSGAYPPEDKPIIGARLEKIAKEIRYYLQDNLDYRLDGRPEIKIPGIPMVSAFSDPPVDIYTASGDNYKLLIFQKKEFLVQLEDLASLNRKEEKRKIKKFLGRLDFSDLPKKSKVASLLANYRAEFCDKLNLGEIPDEAKQIRRALDELANYEPTAKLAESLDSLLEEEINLPVSLKNDTSYNLSINEYEKARSSINKASGELRNRLSSKFYALEKKVKTDILDDWSKFIQKHLESSPRAFDSCVADIESTKRYRRFHAKAENIRRYRIALEIIDELEKNYEQNQAKLNRLSEIPCYLALIYIRENIEPIRALYEVEHVKNLYGELRRARNYEDAELVNQINKTIRQVKDKYKAVAQIQELDEKTSSLLPKENIIAIYFDDKQGPKAFLGQNSADKVIHQLNITGLEDALYALYLVNEYGLP